LSQAGQPLDITAIVTAADSGGSTGVLRDAFKMPAMGDIRKCMISLAAEESVLASVCRYTDSKVLTALRAIRLEI